jgi:hypothetical protein
MAWSWSMHFRVPYSHGLVELEISSIQIHLYHLRSKDIMLRQGWDGWVHLEQLARLRIALHVHDAELAGLLHHEPPARHAFMKYSAIVNDSLFEAHSAKNWFAILTARQIIKAESTRLSLDPD